MTLLSRGLWAFVAAALLAILPCSTAQAQTATIYVNDPVVAAGGAFDSAGAYYVSGNGSIYRVTNNGATVALFGAIPGGGSANGMVFNAAGDLIFSREPGNIYKFAAGCTAPCTATLYATLNGSPEQIAFDSAGNLYVANFSDANIYRVAAGCVQPCASTVHATGPSLETSFGLVVAANNDIYVLSDGGNVNRITAGCVAPCVPTLLTNAGSGGRGLAFDGAGTLYGELADEALVRRIPTDGTVPTVYSTGPGFSFPYGLTKGPDGALYIADNGARKTFRVAAAAPVGPAPVPTLSGWAMILFGTVLAGGAALYIQRRRFTA